MGPGIIIPLILVVVIVPFGLAWAKKLKDSVNSADGPASTAQSRLTSHALRELATPPWRVIYEIADDKLGGIEHVLIGPAGTFALQTSMDPLPSQPAQEP